MAEPVTDRELERMKCGNSRFLERVKADGLRFAGLSSDQHPFAVVLGCADSRVTPEIAFDSGLGELFVVRVVGNVANTSSIASIEYAVAHLGVRLIVVLAHESCGAVGAALEGGDAGVNLNRVLEHITPAVQASPESDVDAVARLNAQLNARRLTSESEVLREAADQDGLRIVTAFLHFTTGVVEFY